MQHAHVGTVPPPGVPEQHLKLKGEGQVVEAGVAEHPDIVHGDLKDEGEHSLERAGVHGVLHKDLPRPGRHDLQAPVGVTHGDGRVQPPEGEEAGFAEFPLGPVHLDGAHPLEGINAPQVDEEPRVVRVSHAGEHAQDLLVPGESQSAHVVDHHHGYVGVFVRVQDGQRVGRESDLFRLRVVIHLVHGHAVPTLEHEEVGGAGPAHRDDEGGDGLGHEGREAFDEGDVVLPFHWGLHSRLEPQQLKAEHVAAQLGLDADDGEEETILAAADGLVTQRELPVWEEGVENLRVDFEAQPHAVRCGPEDVLGRYSTPQYPAIGPGLRTYLGDNPFLLVVLPNDRLLMLDAEHVDVFNEVALSRVFRVHGGIERVRGTGQYLQLRRVRGDHATEASSDEEQFVERSHLLLLGFLDGFGEASLLAGASPERIERLGAKHVGPTLAHAQTPLNVIGGQEQGDV